MLIRNLLIRLAANGIYLVRYRALRSSGLRFLVFTGTSGKTLARTATTHALRAAGLPVMSPPYGYTNELGIVLAVLGIESTHLFTLEGIRKVLSSRAREGSYVAVELGADWRRDIPWFLKRFNPYGVCVTTTTTEEWTRPTKAIWSGKEALVAGILEGGFLCWSAQNESAHMVRAIKAAGHVSSMEFTATPGKGSFVFESRLGSDSFESPLSSITPYTEALGCAVACMQLLGMESRLSKDIFLDYQPPPERFFQGVLPGGAVLVADTYKAVPQCTKYVLDFARKLDAKKRIAVVSAMHPLWSGKRAHYHALAATLAHFDKVYFIGPRGAYALLREDVPEAIYAGLKPPQDLAETLRKEDAPGTVIVIKAAGRYRLGDVVTQLLA